MTECKHEHSHVVEVHPWLRFEKSGESDTFVIAAKGEVLEYKCDDCGAIFYA